MTDWFVNCITITGDKKEKERCLKFVKSKYGVPELKPSSINWRVYGFGVHDDDWIFVMTGGAPASQVFFKLSKKFPSLIFTVRFKADYEGFEGIFECQNGKVLKDECQEYYLEEVESSNEVKKVLIN